MFKTATAVAIALATVAAPAAGPEKINQDINLKIRAEATNNSQIMRTVHYLTDVYGPRLTGSPNHKAAGEWAIKQMTDWGLTNGHLEPWEFGHPGWMNERFSGFVTSPVKDSLVGEVLGWTPSTKGTAAGDAIQIVPPTSPTRDELAAWIASTKPAVAGKIVLVGKAVAVPVTIDKAPLRRKDEDVQRQYDPNTPPSAGPGRGGPPAPPPAEGRVNAGDVNTEVDAMLVAAGALVRLNDAGRDHGQIRAFQNRAYDVTKAVPTVVLRNEDYGRVSRLLADKTPVTLEFTIVNRTYPEGTTSYNTIAEIPGTDKAAEVVMLGGHLDSWHAATGATDNATGCAVMMEAARILKAIGVQPRRTIRVALWGGEEQGLLGSKAYVAQHFGTYENQKPEFATFNGYLNLDSGTGRIRGASVFGPADAATVLRETFAPFADLGVAGALATASRRSGGTDSTTFNEAGLPGIGLSQDPIEYGTYTWHTSLDTYERVIEDDVRKSAMSIAAAVYQLAMRDDMLPRFTKDTMPAPPAPPARTGSGR
jgi:hypothetical protein